MKKFKQMSLACDRVLLVLSTDAWWFLFAETNGVSNVWYLLSLLSHMVVVPTESESRPGVTFSPGQVAMSKRALAEEWKTGRMSVDRLLSDFAKHGIVSLAGNKRGAIISMTCVKCWDGVAGFKQNPWFEPHLKSYQESRINIFNGWTVPVLRSYTLRKKDGKNGPSGTGKKASPVAGNSSGSSKPVVSGGSGAANSGTKKDTPPATPDRNVRPSPKSQGGANRCGETCAPPSPATRPTERKEPGVIYIDPDGAGVKSPVVGQLREKSGNGGRMS